MFLHEMTPLIGHLEVVAAGLLSGYEGGPLHAEIERIRETLAAFEDLRSAADSESLVEFNLTGVVTAVVRERAEASELVEMSAASTGAGESDADVADQVPAESRARRIQATVARDDPVITLGSPRLLRLVLTNAIRNAIEACETVIGDRAARVVVSWGATDMDAWVSVVDDGPGLHPALESPWEVGATTKRAGSHRGLGLVIVDQAVESMDGRVHLIDGEVGGCHFEVRWPIAKEPN
jgi:C4-dicarboxylate-specific signal transduction histidine kinase